MSNARDKANIPVLNFQSKGIDDNADATAITINSSENVLINTTSASGFDSAGLPLIVGSGSTHQGITIFSGTSHQGAIHFADGTGTSSYRGQLNYKHDADAMTFAVTGSEKMRLNSTGLGIGTASPTTKLESTGTILASVDGTGLKSVGANAQIHADASSGYGALIADGASGNDSHIFFQTAGVDKARLTANNSGSFMFGAGGATEKMRITSAGNIGINRTSVDTGVMLDISHPGSSKYALKCDSSETSGTQYHILFSRNGTNAGYITSNSATTIAFNNASDERLKENIENSGSAIQDIKDLKVRQFDWKDNIDTHKDFGFVAQELVNVVPEAVTEGTDELDDNGKPVRSWGVDYSHIVPRLVKAVQEQQTKIENLEAEVTALKNQP